MYGTFSDFHFQVSEFLSSCRYFLKKNSFDSDNCSMSFYFLVVIYRHTDMSQKKLFNAAYNNFYGRKPPFKCLKGTSAPAEVKIKRGYCCVGKIQKNSSIPCLAVFVPGSMGLVHHHD